MRRLTVVATLVVAGTTLAVSGAASTTTTTATPSTTTVARSASGPHPICVGAGATRHCSLWAARDTWAGRRVYTAQFVPDSATPAVRAYAAWIRSSAVDLALYPGYKGPSPSLTLPRGPEEVPPSARPRLLATFNSGFYEYDAAAGFYVNHLLFHPMIRGLATVVRYRNGTVNVQAWIGGPTPSPDVVMARQNLSLLVAGSRPTARAADNALWGSTLGGVPAVWRTALGVTAQGDLVYAAAPDQTSASLAHIMVELHCVRAMQLDINPAWPIFVFYARPGALGPTLFVPNPNQVPDRFLYSSTKDFFAVYVSHHPGEAQPW